MMIVPSSCVTISHVVLPMPRMEFPPTILIAFGKIITASKGANAANFTCKSASLTKMDIKLTGNSRKIAPITTHNAIVKSSE